MEAALWVERTEVQLTPKAAWLSDAADALERIQQELEELMPMKRHMEALMELPVTRAALDALKVGCYCERAIDRRRDESAPLYEHSR